MVDKLTKYRRYWNWTTNVCPIKPSLTSTENKWIPIASGGIDAKNYMAHIVVTLATTSKGTQYRTNISIGWVGEPDSKQTSAFINKTPAAVINSASRWLTKQIKCYHQRAMRKDLIET